MKRRVLLFAMWAALNCAGGSQPLTPIVDAARDGDADGIRKLVAAGANPNERAGINDWTVLMHAIHTNQLASVEALLDAGADPTRGAPNGMTPLMLASGYGQTAIVKRLLACGANPRLKDHRGETAMDYALAGTSDIDDFTLFKCQDSTVHALLAGGAPARAKDGSLRAAKIKQCAAAKLVSG